MKMLTQTEGLSHDKKLISPIAPEPYGDRFIRFIEGITKSPEEAARESIPDPSIPHTNSNAFSTFSNHDRHTSSQDSTRRRSGSAPMHKTSTNNATLQRNENEALKSERRGENEEAAEPRVISTVRSPSAERTGGMQGQTLPVVEELGEASSTGGRSGRSRERPLTPAKDDERPLTPAKDYSPTGNGKTVKGRLSRSSLDKDLPPLPRVASPGEMDGGDSLVP